MKIKHQISCYIKIIEALQTKSYFYEELMTKVVDSISLYDEPINNFSKRTLQRYINDINTLFGVEIIYTNNGYCIKNKDTEHATFSRYLVQQFSVLEAMNLSIKNTEIIFSQPFCELGTKYMAKIVKAINNSFVVSFDYHKFYDDTITKRKVNPYAVKEALGRWYLLAEDKGIIKTFGLDRIHDLSIDNEKFIKKDISIQEKFSGCIGIINPENEKIEEIILTFKKLKSKYIKSYPLHKSQKVISETDDEATFSYQLKVTYDFIMLLFSHHEEVKVIKPLHLKEIVKQKSQNITNQYK